MAMTKETLIKVSTTDAVVSINELRAALKSAREAMNGAEIGSDEYKDALSDVVSIQNQLTNATRVGTTTISSADQSYNALSRTMAQLKQDWKATNDEARRNDLGKRISDLNSRLKELDMSVGVFGRSVGNYERAALGFGNLQFQIQQVARELPSLSIGFDTFFLAISNNVPMLVDELKRAKVEIAALKAEGKSVPSLIGTIAKSIFSWQTALVVVVTALTMFSNDIINWVKGLWSSDDALQSVTASTEELNKKIASGTGNLAENITTVKLLQMQWELLGGSLQHQQQFIANNADEFRKLGVSVKDASDFERIFIAGSVELINALSLRAKAIAAQTLAQEAYQKMLEKQLEVEENIAKGKEYTAVESYGVGSEGFVTKTREYTDEEKEALYEPVRALEAQAQAYLDIAANAKTAGEVISESFGGSDEKESNKAGVGRFSDTTREDEKAWQQQYLDDLLEFEENVYDIRAEMQAENDAFTQQELNNLDKINMAQIKNFNNEKALIESKKKLKTAELKFGASIAASAAKIAGENTVAGKALAVASATVSTFLSAQKAYESQFEPVAEYTSPIRGALAMAAAIASGLANVRAILSVNTDSKGTASMPSVGASVQTAAPAIIQQVPVMRSLTGASEEERLNQLVSNTSQTASGVNQPIKAYVVQSELEGEQLYAETRDKEASF